MRTRIIGALAGLLLPLATIGFIGVADAQTPSASCVAQLVSQAGGSQYPPAAARLRVDRNSVAAGGAITVAGCGTPSGTVRFTLRSHPIDLGSATTDATGFYRAALAVPCDAEQGAHTLTASGAANDSTTVNVSGTTGTCAGVAGVDRPRADAGENLPRTGGSSTAPLVAAGVGLVMIGAATAVTARRRRRSEGA